VYTYTPECANSLNMVEAACPPAMSGAPVITLTPARTPTDPAVLASPGGFAWWYLDLVDSQGNGVVVIWSFGLPFIPGYASAARLDRAPLPSNRPATTLAGYRNGRCVYYDFVVHQAQQAEWTPRHDGKERWRFGRSTFESTDHADGTRTVRIDLDRPVPGTTERLRGHIDAQGPVRLGGRDSESDTHVWSPLMLACEGRARLSTPSWHLGVQGRAYHDRNAARRPLHALGIRRWWWGRLSLPTHDLVWYRLEPDAEGTPVRELVLRVERSGEAATASHPMRLGARRKGRYGLSSPATVELRDPQGHAAMIVLDSLVDDGPFYQRHLVSGMSGGERGHGVAELVVPGRVDLDLHRPFVRMAVHQQDGPNSLFLPLFSGPSTGRTSRLPWWWGRSE